MNLFVWIFVLFHLRGGETVENVVVPLGTVEMVSLTANSTVKLIVKEEPLPSDNFWTFEAHSQDNSDILAFSDAFGNPFVSHDVAEESIPVQNHRGLTVFRRDLDNSTKRASAFLSNLSPRNLTVVVVARNYTVKHPIPGFANETKGENAPTLYFNSDTVVLDFTPAKLLHEKEESPILTYSVYQRFLSERDYDQDHFLSQLSTTMLQLDDIIDNGKRIDPDFVIHNASKTVARNRLIASAYPGTASIFAVIVTTTYPSQNGSRNQAFSSLYVTTSTYACQLENGKPLSCKTMWTTITKVFCGLSVFIGGFVAFFGHRHYQSLQFFVGAYAIGLCSFILLSIWTDGALVSYTEQMGLSIAIGIIGGFLWVVVWYLLGIPILSTAMSVALMGLMLGGSFVFLPALNTIGMTSDAVYWLTIGAFMIGSLVAVLPFTKTASILSSAAVGSFIFIIPIDHYIGSSLKYILVNFVRRTYVENFNLAVLNFPFQTNDIGLLCGWIGLFVLAFIVQCLRERKRAPFPPNPYQLRRWRNEERSFMSENAINDAEDEHRPLLVPEPSAPPSHDRPMSPTSRSPRSPRGDIPGATGVRPVVGYISSSNNRNNYGALSMSPSVIRSLESPSLYNAQPRGVVPPPSPGHRFRWTQRSEQQLVMGTSIEENFSFRPPPDDPSQK